MNVILKKKNIDTNPALSSILSEKFGINSRLAGLLVSRGIDDEDKINRFLYPDEASLFDPYLMTDMDKAHDRLKTAIENGEKVVIYGDYDNDGVCAAAILALFLSSKGLNVGVHIPNRYFDGYGLNIDSINEIVEKENPDLILTCDCGISCIEEISYINELGIDTIVTDHHEPGCEIPEGIVVNPKRTGDKYPDRMLCGAGVAFKLIQTLSDGKEYMEYIDLVAVATIADLVPLLNENRLIVQLGLEKIKSGCFNIGLKRLFENSGLDEIVSSGDIAFKICPRINAAGRIGDAYRAFELLSTDNESRIKELIDEFDSDNEKRKILCDKIYSEALILLKNESLLDSRCIILVNEKWEKGVTGIVAAKFAGEFNRPTFIIVDKDERGVYKGTCRGIDGINIYNALSVCSDCLIEYGGHNGAAGFSIHESNLAEFEVRINEYFSSFDEDLFLKTVSYDLALDVNEIDREFCESLNMLEPTGQDNKKPLFLVNVKNPKVSPCKNSVHTQIEFGKCLLFAYNNIKKNQFLLGDDQKSILFEISGLKGKMVFGTLKQVVPTDIYSNPWYDSSIYLYDVLYHGLLYVGKKGVYTQYDEANIGEIIGNNNFGTLIISSSRQNSIKAYEIIKDRPFLACFSSLGEMNNYSALIISPDIDEINLKNYDKIILTDAAPESFVCYLNALNPEAEIFVPRDSSMKNLAKDIKFDREIFTECFLFIKQYQNLIVPNIVVTLRNIQPVIQGISLKQFVVCFSVFYDLGFIYFENGNLMFDGNVKKPLNESFLYSELKGDL